ncbi:LD-carboxypeptidase [Arthrobacter sp. BPSS-3]|uniref:LD-carboxypeptidase n=1 Tax=Arthrobacter sp. BPSS-3 TaxID=3366580 RepID=UPI0037DCCF00
MRRLAESTGLVPVEYPTTRQLGASAQARAADINAAFADPSIRAVLATIGGNDQITVIKHINADVVVGNPKPFLGYSGQHKPAQLPVGPRNPQLLRWFHAGTPGSRPTC